MKPTARLVTAAMAVSSCLSACTSKGPEPTAIETRSGHVSLPGSVDGILQGLELGNVAFNAPETMNVDDTAVIELVLSVQASIDDLKRRIQAEGRKEGARIQVSDRMEARLTGAGFAITEITPEVQAVSKVEVTSWKWEVRPTSRGLQSLHLTVSALLDVENQSTPRVIRTFDRTIQIEVTWSQRAGAFVEGNWQWLWATIVVPVAAWLWKKRRARRAAERRGPRPGAARPGM